MAFKLNRAVGKIKYLSNGKYQPITAVVDMLLTFSIRCKQLNLMRISINLRSFDCKRSFVVACPTLPKLESMLELPKLESMLELPKLESMLELPKLESMLELPKLESMLELPKLGSMRSFFGLRC